MLVVRKIEDPAYPIRKLISSQQTVRFYDLALAVNPLGLDGVKPRTLLRKKAADDPHPASALLDFAVVSSEPAPDLPGDVPAGVIPDEDHDLLSSRFELLAAPSEKLGRYGTHGPPIYESQPCLVEFGQVESVAGDGFRSSAGVVFGDRPLDEAKGRAFLGPTAQGGQCHPAPPALVQETHRPSFGVVLGHCHQPVAPPFFLSYKGSGEVIHRLGDASISLRAGAKA